MEPPSTGRPARHGQVTLRPCRREERPSPSLISVIFSATGTSRDGERGRLYSATQDRTDGDAFLDRGKDDRHQFRVIRLA